MLPRKAKFDFSSAGLEEIIQAKTSDIYFFRTREILKKEKITPLVTVEFFSQFSGILCGISEVEALLEKVLKKSKKVNSGIIDSAWALPEGAKFSAKEVVLRITGNYLNFGIYETAILGILSHCSGWATAARRCVEAAGKIPVISFGARHVHPKVSGRMDYAAIVGGCVGCSTPEGAYLSGTAAIGTMPHALILIIGDTLKAALAFHEHMPEDVPRIILVDTFKDEVEESLRVAEVLKKELSAVRFDTPVERGRVTVDLIKEARAKLDLAGYKQVKIVASGGLNPERIRNFIEEKAPVDTFAV